MAEAVVKKIYPERAESAEAKTKAESPAARARGAPAGPLLLEPLLARLGQRAG